MTGKQTQPSLLQWVVVVAGLGLVFYLAVAGTRAKDFDFTYVALVTLGLVGLIVPKADRSKDDEHEPR